MVENRHLQESICDIFEMVPEIKDGKERMVEQNVLVKMVMNNDITSFAGLLSAPVFFQLPPAPEEEVENNRYNGPSISVSNDR